MACPIWKGYNILEAMVVHISLRSFLLKTQADIKKKKCKEQF